MLGDDRYDPELEGMPVDGRSPTEDNSQLKEGRGQTADGSETPANPDNTSSIAERVLDESGIRRSPEVTKAYEHEEKPSQIYERREFDINKVEVTYMGRLSGKKDTVAQRFKRWSGKISLADRLSDSESVETITRDEVDSQFGRIKNYLVRAYRSARVRCVDGRVIDGYDENRERMKKRDLGPQVAGGTPGAAVCFSLARGPKDETYKTSTFEDDFQEFSQQIKSLGFELGGHTDDKHKHGETGCGAIDNMQEIIRNMVKPEYTIRLRELTKAVLGEDMYDQEVFSVILGNAVQLNAESDEYFQNYKQTIFSKLQQQSKNAISKLIGNHNEVGVLVNRVYGTTFHRDEFSADSGHKIQAFNYDFWRSVELTETLINNDKYYGDMSLEERIREGKKILTARVMYTVATLITLTDGSLDLYVADEKITIEDDQPDNIIDLTDSFGKRTPYAPKAVLQDAA